MDYAEETLLAAELADQWISSILSEQPDLLLTPDGEAASPAVMAQCLAEFRLHLIEALEDQPLGYYTSDDEDDEDGDFLDMLATRTNDEADEEAEDDEAEDDEADAARDQKPA